MIVFVLTILLSGQSLKMVMAFHTSVGCQNFGQETIEIVTETHQDRADLMTFKCDEVLMAAKD